MTFRGQPTLPTGLCTGPSLSCPPPHFLLALLLLGLEGTARARGWMLRLEISSLVAGRREGIPGISWPDKSLTCGSRGDLYLAVRGTAMPAGLRLPFLGVGGDATSLGLQGRGLLSPFSGFVSSCLLKSRGRFQPPLQAATGASLLPVFSL